MAVHELDADIGANMRVTINHELSQRREESPGFLASLFSPRGTINEYVVSLKIELTEEERAILAAHQLWDVHILTRPFYIPADVLRKHPVLESEVGAPIHYQIKDLVGADARDGMFHQTFATPLDAANFEAELKNDILPNLKSYIEASRDAGSRSSQTFEL
jgi:hypothetical protein